MKVVILCTSNLNNKKILEETFSLSRGLLSIPEISENRNLLTKLMDFFQLAELPNHNENSLKNLFYGKHSVHNEIQLEEICTIEKTVKNGFNVKHPLYNSLSVIKTTNFEEIKKINKNNNNSTKCVLQLIEVNYELSADELKQIVNEIYDLTIAVFNYEIHAETLTKECQVNEINPSFHYYKNIQFKKFVNFFPFCYIANNKIPLRNDLSKNKDFFADFSNWKFGVNNIINPSHLLDETKSLIGIGRMFGT